MTDCEKEGKPPFPDPKQTTRKRGMNFFVSLQALNGSRRVMKPPAIFTALLWLGMTFPASSQILSSKQPAEPEGNQAPELYLTRLPGRVVPDEPVTLTIETTDRDGDPVPSVQVFVDGHPIGNASPVSYESREETGQSGTSLTWEIEWKTPKEGLRRISARASDIYGRESKSQPLHVVVGESNDALYHVLHLAENQKNRVLTFRIPLHCAGYRIEYCEDLSTGNWQNHHFGRRVMLGIHGALHYHSDLTSLWTTERSDARVVQELICPEWLNSLGRTHFFRVRPLGWPEVMERLEERQGERGFHPETLQRLEEARVQLQAAYPDSPFFRQTSMAATGSR
ncbi:MAG: hypothetical protein AAF514_09175 [Verrucomicrobiota bacterium]